MLGLQTLQLCGLAANSLLQRLYFCSIAGYSLLQCLQLCSFAGHSLLQRGHLLPAALSQLQLCLQLLQLCLPLRDLTQQLLLAVRRLPDARLQTLDGLQVVLVRPPVLVYCLLLPGDGVLQPPGGRAQLLDAVLLLADGALLILDPGSLTGDGVLEVSWCRSLYILRGFTLIKL